ncbi:MAG: hypothetical protein ACRD2L_02715, partial [Terriglobia bacterium]
MANKPNCGVFDELTRKCLACGMEKEGKHCETWELRKIDFLELSAKFMGYTKSIHEDYENLLRLPHGSRWTYWDPRTQHEQLQLLFMQLLYHWGLRTEADNDGFIVGSLVGVRSYNT